MLLQIIEYWIRMDIYRLYLQELTSIYPRIFNAIFLHFNIFCTSRSHSRLSRNGGTRRRSTSFPRIGCNTFQTK